MGVVPMHELTGFQRDMIYCIAALDEPYGFEIGWGLEEYSPIEISHSLLYSNLHDLVDKGLVRKETKDDRTHQYTLTVLSEEIIVERRQWENEQLEATNINFE